MKHCKIQDCGRRIKGLGYCKLHYDRFKKHGDPLNTGRNHGLVDTPEYKAWCHMKERCNNPKSALYGRYGGRGITVCDDWNNSFKKFYADMGKRPTPAHSLERIDNNDGYYPKNCKWATKLEQVLNRNANKNNTSGYRGVTWYPQGKKWQAQIFINYKHISLGYFSNPEDAYAAYLKAKENR